DGNDILLGGAGADSIDTGNGTNLADGGAGDDTIGGGLNNDALHGGAGDDTIFANSGDDLVLGGDGRDSLFGDSGNDTLQGGAGDDFVDGGDGNDIIVGGAGQDQLSGGAGSDTFVYCGVSHSTPGAADIIQDFSSADHDLIDLSAIDASSKAGGNQAFSFIGTGAFDGHAGELRIELIDASTLLVQADVNGDKAADFQIEVHGVDSLAATDFVL
uniref:calcium-binding protein n=1 Tax=Inquilinus sp. TaxID=1932117 RepID=UPI003784E0B3